MQPSVRFVLALHNHQPVGNFDHVFQQAYQDAYRPFLELFAQYGPELKIALHLSGPLALWLEKHHPEYLDQVAQLVQAGRIELLGGPFYEAILTMLQEPDRVGQIELYSAWLAKRFGVRVRGIWTPERVWEPTLPASLAKAGVEFTVLDDFHFLGAGLAPQELWGYFLTEDQGQVVFLFPGSERLRYLIPFAPVEEVLEFLRRLGQGQPGAVAVFADDGEKFGIWPQTKEHVYEQGYLKRLFDALVQNRDWLQMCTFQEVLRSVPPRGKVYLPECSYREMTRWALPPLRAQELQQLEQECQGTPGEELLRRFVRGGFWRNFRVKYPEANEMYCRQLAVSQRLAQAQLQFPEAASTLEQARVELYQGQCNCAYWHGAFGGLYLPHLRHAVYAHLIRADTLLDQVEHGSSSWVKAAVKDWNLDARQEVRLDNPQLSLWVAPSRGGHVYHWELKPWALNLLATMSRQEEPYHEQIRHCAQLHADQVASIHDRVVCKQPDLDQHLIYDSYPRKALLDHFWPLELSPKELYQGQAPQLGDFLQGVYHARVRRSPEMVQLVLQRTGQVQGHRVEITKCITVPSGGTLVQVEYRLQGLPPEPVRFAVEWGIAGLPPEAEDRFFQDLSGQIHGHLGTQLCWEQAQGVRLVDQYQDLVLVLSWSRPGALWTLPVCSVNQSEAGFELVHQSVALFVHWELVPGEQQEWTTSFTFQARRWSQLALEPTSAQARQNP